MRWREQLEHRARSRGRDRDLGGSDRGFFNLPPWILLVEIPAVLLLREAGRRPVRAGLLALPWLAALAALVAIPLGGAASVVAFELLPASIAVVGLAWAAVACGQPPPAGSELGRGTRAGESRSAGSWPTDEQASAFSLDAPRAPVIARPRLLVAGLAAMAAGLALTFAGDLRVRLMPGPLLERAIVTETLLGPRHWAELARRERSPEEADRLAEAILARLESGEPVRGDVHDWFLRRLWDGTLTHAQGVRYADDALAVRSAGAARAVVGEPLQVRLLLGVPREHFFGYPEWFWYEWGLLVDGVEVVSPPDAFAPRPPGAPPAGAWDRVRSWWHVADGADGRSGRQGDTLFLEGCGRTDLPGSDPTKMAESLRRLAEVPDSTILFPGHRYSIASSATMEIVKEMNFVFQ